MNKRLLRIFNESGFHQPEMERLGIEGKFEKFSDLFLEEVMQTLIINGHDEAVDELNKHFGIK